MSAAVLIIDFHEIQQVRQRKVSPSKLDKIAVGLRETANLVKQEWSNFSPKSRERLKELAFDTLLPSCPEIIKTSLP